MTLFHYHLVFLLLGALPAWQTSAQPLPEISSTEAQDIGRKIWQNECGGTVEGLTAWNQGENFASLGIGHFIWYPSGQEGPFDESFPKLIHFISARGGKIPSWLLNTPDCPWGTREAFLKETHGERLQSLRIFLKDHVDLQARFCVERIEKALPRLLAEIPEENRSALSRKFYRLASTPQGLYALIDYVNFKGEGLKTTERYHGQGWGLLQVLQTMVPSEVESAPDAFADAADQVLTLRVKNSPPERHETRWLPGWKNRLKTYRR
jgi:hypothetical protein